MDTAFVENQRPQDWKYSVSELPGSTEYYVIDIVKFICAYLVFIIHFSPFSSYNSVIAEYVDYALQKCIARIAVPFFFASAGFFLFRKIDIAHFDTNIIIDYVFKILRLYGIWTVILFVGSKLHLWYLGGVVIAVVFISICFTKKIALKKIISLSLVLYALGLLGDSYYGLIVPLREIQIIDYIFKAYELLFKTTRNGLFMGVPFVLIGVIFAQKKMVMKKSKAILGFVISCFLLFLEAFIFKIVGLPKDYNMYVSLLPLTFFLFYITTHIQVKPRKLYKKLRIVGMLVFCNHLFVKHILKDGFLKEFAGIEITNSFIAFTVTMLISTLSAFLIEHLSHNKKLSWIKWLYS